MAPDHLSVPFLKNGSRCSWVDLDSSSDDRLVAATVRCDSHHQQRFERKGTSWPWVPAGAIASREPRFWRGQKPLSFKAPAASQGTTNPRLLTPSRATAAFTARSGQRVATTHRDEVLRQAGSTPSPTTAPSDIHRLPPRVSDRPMRRPWASGRFWPLSDNQVVLFSGGALPRGGLAVVSLGLSPTVAQAAVYLQI